MRLFGTDEDWCHHMKSGKPKRLVQKPPPSPTRWLTLAMVVVIILSGCMGSIMQPKALGAEGDPVGGNGTLEMTSHEPESPDAGIVPNPPQETPEGSDAVNAPAPREETEAEQGEGMDAEPDNASATPDSTVPETSETDESDPPALTPKDVSPGQVTPACETPDGGQPENAEEALHAEQALPVMGRLGLSAMGQEADLPVSLQNGGFETVTGFVNNKNNIKYGNTAVAHWIMTPGQEYTLYGTAASSQYGALSPYNGSVCLAVGLNETNIVYQDIKTYLGEQLYVSFMVCGRTQTGVLKVFVEDAVSGEVYQTFYVKMPKSPWNEFRTDQPIIVEDNVNGVGTRTRLRINYLVEGTNDGCLIDNVVMRPWVEDTTPPTGVGISSTQSIGSEIGEAAKFVGAVSDDSGRPVTITYEGTPPSSAVAGTFAVKVRLTDWAGNYTIITTSVRIFSLPVLTQTARAPYVPGTWTKDTVTVDYVASEGENGIDLSSFKIYDYQIFEWVPYTSASTTLTVEYAAEGIHMMWGLVKDGWGNVTTTSYQYIYIDKTPPTTNIVDNAVYTYGATVTYSDAYSGIDIAKVDNTPIHSGYPVTAKGPHILTLVDHVGHTTTRTFYITDGTVPVIEFAATEQGENNLFTTCFRIYKASGAPVNWASVKLYKNTPTDVDAFCIDQTEFTTSMDEIITFSDVPAGTYTVIAKDTYGAQTTRAVTIGPHNEQIISISVPTKLMFAAFAAEGGGVSSPEYQIVNNSLLDVSVRLSHFSTTFSDGVQMTSSQEAEKLHLNLTPVSGFTQGINGIATGAQADGSLGVLGSRFKANHVGTFRLEGRYRGLFTATPKRPQYQSVFTFELVIPDAT